MAQCKVCSHEKRRDIDRTLLTRGQVMKVATQYGLCRGTVWNHYKKHLPWRPQRRPKAVTVQEQMEDMKFELRRLQILGECGESIGGAIQALRERRALLELEARMDGKLDATHKKLMMNSRQPEGEYEVRFINGRPRTVPVSEK